MIASVLPPESGWSKLFSLRTEFARKPSLFKNPRTSRQRATAHGPPCFLGSGVGRVLKFGFEPNESWRLDPARGGGRRPPVSASTACSTAVGPKGRPAAGLDGVDGRSRWVERSSVDRRSHHPRPNRSPPGGQRAPTPELPRRRPSPARRRSSTGYGHGRTASSGQRARQANRALTQQSGFVPRRRGRTRRKHQPGSRPARRYGTADPSHLTIGGTEAGVCVETHQTARFRHLAPAAYTPPPWNVSIS